MRDSEQSSERPRRSRNSSFWQKVGVGVLGVTTAAGGVVAVNKALESTNKTESKEVADHILALKNTGTNDDRGIDSQAELDTLKAKLGDKVNLGIVPRAEHTGVVPAGDTVGVDETSPMSEIKWNGLKEPKFILLGNVHYEGPMSAAQLVAVGPDGKEFFKDTEAGSAVDMVNPILEPSTEGLVFYGSSGTVTTRVTISYDGLLRTVTHEGFGVDQAQANRYGLTVNGQALSESSSQNDPSKKGENVIAELQAKADEYIMAVTDINGTLGLSMNPMVPATGEIDRLTRSAQIRIGELPSGESVALDGPRSITFIGS